MVCWRSIIDPKIIDPVAEHEDEPEHNIDSHENDGNALSRVLFLRLLSPSPILKFSQVPSAHVGHRHPSISRPRKKGHDLGVLGVLIHVIGDAINNIGVIISALVIWLAHYPGRFYADPGVSTGIAIMILTSAIPLGKWTGDAIKGSNTCTRSQEQRLDPIRECPAWSEFGGHTT